MKFEKLTVPTQRELFIKKMQEMILSGELPAHTRIPPERDLAKQMGISRSVVNTGIAILEYQGFLQVINRQGTFVADYKKTASVETLNAIMRLKGDVLTDHDIWLVVNIIDHAVAANGFTGQDLLVLGPFAFFVVHVSVDHGILVKRFVSI